MRRMMMAMAMVVGVSSQAGAAPPRAKAKGPARVPDASTPVAAGDRAVVAEDGKFQLPDPSAYAATDRATLATLGMYLTDPAFYAGEISDLMLAQRRVVSVAGRAPVEVRAIVPHAELHARMGDGAEVAVAAGPLAGRTLWMRRQDLVRMVERPPAKKKGR